jgi:hypothetical protein
MKLRHKIAAIVALVLTSFAMPAPKVSAADDDQYSFTVRNRNVQKITQLLLSEDGRNWGYFDIGKGIPAGKIVKLYWDKSTNNAGCNWYVKAVYADESVSAPARFNFCEDNVAIAFDAPRVRVADDDQYSFTVRNRNVQKITQLLLSEDGRNWGHFDIGKGIPVGKTVKLDWDKSTNNAGCNWYIKAVYADKSVGQAVRFNFCQEDLVIDF